MEGAEGTGKATHLTSAAAFVEGGVQDPCDDACSICLEVFCDSDPSTVTTCKHEFHFQCILEWCQRSSQCPMCWQPISLKDPTSQELLEAVERERSIRQNPSRNSTIFRHPALGDFELQHLPVGMDSAEIEERILQHLSAAATMGRARQAARREGQRARSSAQGHPQFLLFSGHPHSSSLPSSPSPEGESEPVSSLITNHSNAFMEGSPELNTLPSSSHPRRVSPLASEPNIQPGNNSQDSAGPSDLQSFSESLKSRLNSVSMRYKESISRSTRSWKEKFFSRNNTSMSEIGSEVRREVNAGIATVSRMMERLDTKENNTNSSSSSSNNKVGTAAVSSNASEGSSASDSMRSTLHRSEASDGDGDGHGDDASLNGRGANGPRATSSGSSGISPQSSLH